MLQQTGSFTTKQPQTLDTGHWTLDTGHWTLDTWHRQGQVPYYCSWQNPCSILDTLRVRGWELTLRMFTVVGEPFPKKSTHRWLSSDEFHQHDSFRLGTLYFKVPECLDEISTCLVCLMLCIVFSFLYLICLVHYACKCVSCEYAVFISIS